MIDGDENPFPSLEMVQRRTGHQAWARLGTNENEFGAAPGVLSSIAEAAGLAHRYPDCDHYDLRHALGGWLGVRPDSLHVGSGIDGLLGQACRTLAGAGGTVVTTQGTYPTFAYFAGAIGAAVEQVPYRGLRVDAQALVERATRCGADLVYLAEPDNPTGSTLGRELVYELLDTLPDRTVLLIDGAYAEYQDPADRIAPGGLADQRVLWLRTFSKAHGLAGLRVGYAHGPPELLRRLRKGAEHYVVGRVAQQAALAALDYPDHLAWVVEQTARGRAHYAGALSGAGCAVLPTQTNFVTFRPAGDLPAAEVERALAGAGVFVRRLAAPGLDALLRLTVGPPDQRDAVLTWLLPLLTTRSAHEPFRRGRR